MCYIDDIQEWYTVFDLTPKLSKKKSWIMHINIYININIPTYMTIYTYTYIYIL